jgi:hypothetical protein
MVSLVTRPRPMWIYRGKLLLFLEFLGVQKLALFHLNRTFRFISLFLFIILQNEPTLEFWSGSEQRFPSFADSLKIVETYWHDHSLESSRRALSDGTIIFSIQPFICWFFSLKKSSLKELNERKERMATSPDSRRRFREWKWPAFLASCLDGWQMRRMTLLPSNLVGRNAVPMYRNDSKNGLEYSWRVCGGLRWHLLQMAIITPRV